ncbi:hypothetical protein LJC15_00010 [Desulfovibrio sp. OttesenSCG-928-G11]|nr:hypothetical protein [Desulfovibrio sp. OttesenSCG-928-G11]
MYKFDQDIEQEAQKLEAKIKKLQEEKAKLKERMEAEKDRQDLARKVGIMILTEFEGKAFEYSSLLALFDKHLISDFDRQFFNLPPLAEDDPRRPKKRGRRKKENTLS